MNEQKRHHSLDNLRAAIMWLGIVLHVMANHMVGKFAPAPWRDKETSMGANLVLAFIHTFRMPLFFILAGFFVAMLVRQRGYGGMLRHRLLRLGLPFVIFWPLIFAATAVLAMMYVHLMVHGTVGIDPSIMPKSREHPVINTLHLWFIYYLMLFCILTACAGYLGNFVSRDARGAMARSIAVLATRWWGAFILTLPLVAVGAFTATGVVVSSSSFVPHVDEIIQNGLFFVFGIYLFPIQENAFAFYEKKCWHFALGGMLAFIAYLGMFEKGLSNPAAFAGMKIWIAAAFNLAAWFWSFAALGLALRYASRQNRVLRYVSDSSYWVYLVNMLGTIGFGILLYRAPLSAWEKIGLNILATTVACLVTYHLFVRFTPIGSLLNGRRVLLRRTAEVPSAASQA